MRKVLLGLSTAAVILALASCNNNNKKQSEGNSDSVKVGNTAVSLDKANFEKTVDGKQVNLYTLKNENNASVVITNYGGRVISIVVPNKDGGLTDVALGYDKLESYQVKGEAFFGAIIGRYGNRIGKGKFSLDGKTYQLELNDGSNSLHGGNNGFYAKVWDVEESTDNKLVLSYISADGEAGYPGTLNVKVTYTLEANNSLKIDYEATTDKKTVVNLTNHTYFNLNGEGDSTILDHELMISANAITPVDNTLIPTGELMPVEGTPFDFNKPTRIGDRIETDNEQLKFGKGYDHNWVLHKSKGLQTIANVYSAKTGIQMDVITEEPGLQFYSGNFMTGAEHNGKGGKAYPFRSAFCLETQHFPDSPNHANFPSTVLKPGSTYKTTTVYKFSVRK
ncbi:aldose 1-epimerase [Pseudopedobacter saltans DSM 12145]|uniref:Aldose 1-epimerase n=1 Tax=Pseudopedobacter saltans (strain ATCC 51119 / DSM 12145 / JCM 21818 / CCUG 39354 / LMG 10337 / NBRC 100064 / NCIMB 13643) TaxID=762903 RepID=F0SDI1_PSESL|nr:aldose epimerase family protein [Pseudopedobacter saltans]ADY53964.1 aldose 1-epimerase [Pseudopedobacter saltans DSM 12145]